MKNLSKVLAVVLALAMALSMVSFAAYTDVEAGADCEEAVTVLSALEILKGYEDGSFKPDATITRAEFATVVIRLLGLADTATGGATIFTDVAADHWANGYIALAAQQGIVNGYGDGRFGPEDPVKYQEAIKMVVAALGYTPMADANGGYPGGYQVVASQKGILAGISGAKANEPATRGVVAQLGYNALTVPLMEQTGYGTQTNFQTVNSLLLNKLGVTKFEGVVTATSLSSSNKDGKVTVDYDAQITAVAGQSTAKKYDPAGVNGVNCNPVTLNAGSSSVYTIDAAGEVEEAAKELIDVASIMYVKAADTDDAELVCILKNGNRNATVSFATEDLRADAAFTNADADATTADATIEVYTDKDAGDTEEYVLNIKKVYVNGRTKSILDASGVTAGSEISSIANKEAVVGYYLDNDKHADVTLLSQTEDEYNVAYITVYDDVKVTSIADRKWQISFNPYTANNENIGSKVILDETDKDLKFEIYKDGEVASFADIKKDDILSIAGYINASDELAYGKVYIVSDKVEGKVTARSTGKVSVDGVAYKSTATGFNLGDTAVFFKNYRGVLVAVDTTATAANVKYGFATYIRGYDADYGEAAQIRLLNAEGKWETLQFADKVSINGATKVDTKGVNWTTASYVDGAALTGVALPGGGYSSTKLGVNDMVAYDLNSDGKVGKIYLKNIASAFEVTSVGASKEYDADTAVMGDIFMDDATVIYNLAANSIYRDRDLDTTESNVSIVAATALVSGNDYNIISKYDEDDSGIIGAILGYDMAGGINYADNFFVLTEEGMDATNAAGDTGILLKGIKAGEVVELFINDEDSITVSKTVFDGTADANSDITIASQSAAAFAPNADGDGIATLEASDFEMGDVILFTLDSKNEAAEVVVLIDASDVVKTSASTYGYLDKIDGFDTDNVVVAEIEGNVNYKFVTGYVKERKENGNITILAEDNTAEMTLTFADDVVGSLYDAYTGDGKVEDAGKFDISDDSLKTTAGADGDIVFARVIGTRIVEFVTFANN
ncbi:MAG: S-layer homology domain-containing protein [Clostridia bacterium]|nr:S-layer homology domain-containing protein [Clostridia bacterium]